MKRSRGWVFTANNYDDASEARISLAGAQYHVYGREVGESGTPHLQGYLYFPQPKSHKQLKGLLPGFFLENRKGTHSQARDYCIKDGDYVEVGTPPQKNGGDTMVERAARNKRLREIPLVSLVETGEICITQVRKLKNARMDLDQELMSFTAEGVRGLWIHGPPGTGKSHEARQYDDVYIKAQNKWFDGYTGQETILLEDLDTNVLGHYLKIWADKWSCTGEVKGGTVPLRHKRFIVTSNYSPRELWPEDLTMAMAIERRFEFKEKLIKFAD